MEIKLADMWRCPGLHVTAAGNKEKEWMPTSYKMTKNAGRQTNMYLHLWAVIIFPKVTRPVTQSWERRLCQGFPLSCCVIVFQSRQITDSVSGFAVMRILGEIIFSRVG